MNELTEHESQLSPGALAEILEKLTLLLGPFAPYLAEELWEELGRKGPLVHQQWPAFDPDLARDAEAEVVVQVNGKVRSRLLVPHDTPGEELQRLALADAKVQPHVAGKQLVKVIVVPGRLVNAVVK